MNEKLHLSLSHVVKVTEFSLVLILAFTLVINDENRYMGEIKFETPPEPICHSVKGPLLETLALKAAQIL